MKSQKLSVKQQRSPARVPSLVVTVLLLCLSTASVEMCVALPTHYAASSASFDGRVEQLRRVLHTTHHLETIPDPPRELGIHTACRKFGRGCPDTYVTFLENVVASLQPTVEAAATDTPSSAAPPTSAEPVSTTVKASAPTDFVEDASTASFGSPSVLRLPVQTSWSYAELKRLESMLVRIKVAEIELDKSGISSRALQERYRVPRGADLVLQDDHAGEATARLLAACASLSARSSGVRGSSTMTAQEAMLLKVWCRHMDHRRSESETEDGGGLQRTESASGAPLLFQLPAFPLACYANDVLRWFARLLLELDPALTSLVTWTWSVALPSAAMVAVGLWVFVGGGWGDEVEDIIFGAADATGTTDGCPQEADDAPAALTEVQYRRSRLAGLRYTFLQCAQHRASSMTFLKLRLVLCLLVAVSILGSFGQVMYATLRPATGSAASSSFPTLSLLTGFVFRLMPTWCQVAVSVYVVLALQGAVLLMALKGAASAYTDWQDFTADCAVEYEYLLRAVGDVAG